MRILKRSTLRDFWEANPGAEQPLKAWYKIAKGAEWKKVAEVQTALPGISRLADNRVCFNISGNTYRLIVRFDYRFQMAFIRFVGTHAEYDRIDANTI